MPGLSLPPESSPLPPTVQPTVTNDKTKGSHQAARPIDKMTLPPSGELDLPTQYTLEDSDVFARLREEHPIHAVLNSPKQTESTDHSHQSSQTSLEAEPAPQAKEKVATESTTKETPSPLTQQIREKLREIRGKKSIETFPTLTKKAAELRSAKSGQQESVKFDRFGKSANVVIKASPPFFVSQSNIEKAHAKKDPSSFALTQEAASALLKSPELANTEMTEELKNAACKVAEYVLTKHAATLEKLSPEDKDEFIAQILSDLTWAIEGSNLVPGETASLATVLNEMDQAVSNAIKNLNLDDKTKGELEPQLKLIAKDINTHLASLTSSSFVKAVMQPPGFAHVGATEFYPKDQLVSYLRANLASESAKAPEEQNQPLIEDILKGIESIQIADHPYLAAEDLKGIPLLQRENLSTLFEPHYLSTELQMLNPERKGLQAELKAIQLGESEGAKEIDALYNPSLSFKSSTSKAEDVKEASAAAVLKALKFGERVVTKTKTVLEGATIVAKEESPDPTMSPKKTTLAENPQGIAGVWIEGKGIDPQDFFAYGRAKQAYNSATAEFKVLESQISAKTKDLDAIDKEIGKLTTTNIDKEIVDSKRELARDLLTLESTRKELAKASTGLFKAFRAQKISDLELVVSTLGKSTSQLAESIGKLESLRARRDTLFESLQILKTRQVSLTKTLPLLEATKIAAESKIAAFATPESLAELLAVDILVQSLDNHVLQLGTDDQTGHAYNVDQSRFLGLSDVYTRPDGEIYAAFRSDLLDHPIADVPLSDPKLKDVRSKLLALNPQEIEEQLIKERRLAPRELRETGLSNSEKKEKELNQDYYDLGKRDLKTKDLLKISKRYGIHQEDGESIRSFKNRIATKIVEERDKARESSWSQVHPQAFENMCLRIQKMQELLKSNPDCTLKDLWKVSYPDLAPFYEAQEILTSNPGSDIMIERTQDGVKLRSLETIWLSVQTSSVIPDDIKKRVEQAFRKLEAQQKTIPDLATLQISTPTGG